MGRYLFSLFLISTLSEWSVFAEQSYVGHGIESVSAETLKNFAPPALPSELSRRIQSLLDLRSPGMGIPSEDGRHLAFSWAVTGTRQIWRMDGPLSFPIQMTGGEDATAIAAWTPDNKYLILSRDRKGEEYPGLYLQKVQGGELIEIQHKPKINTEFAFVSEDSKYIYFRANDIRRDSYAIYQYAIETRTKTLIFSEVGYWEILDHKPDGTCLLANVKGNMSQEIFLWNMHKKELKPLLGLGDGDELDMRFAHSDGEYLLLTNKYSDFRRLYLFKSQDAEPMPLTAEMDMDISSFSIDAKRSRILYVVNDRGYSHVEAMNAKTFEKITLPTLSELEQRIFGSTTLNSRFTSFAIFSANRPETSYVYDWASGQMTQWLLPSSPEISTDTFIHPELEAYIARDGTKIPMFVYRSPTCQKPCPVIVDFHGGPESQAKPSFSLFVQLMLAEGFSYVLPNVRGSDGYGKKWVEADDGRKRMEVITDIEDAAIFIRQQWAHQGLAPKIAITGGSYGGYATLLAMTKFAGAYDAGFSVVGISNLITFLENTAPYRRALRIVEYGDPIRDKEVLEELSPTRHIGKIAGPLMIIQGVNDPRVPAGEAIQIYEKMKARHLDGQLVLFPDEGHGVSKRANIALMMGYKLQFFKKHLMEEKKVTELSDKPSTEKDEL